jgi:regulatory protein
MSSAFDAAVRLLKGRAKSRARLEQALVIRGFEAAAIAEALRRVTELGYLDDSRYADAKARTALAEGRSIADVERRLEADGIDPALAAQASRSAAAEGGHDDLDAARALLAKRKVQGARAARLLASRGFSEDVIEQLVELE